MHFLLFILFKKLRPQESERNEGGSFLRFKGFYFHCSYLCNQVPLPVNPCQWLRPITPHPLLARIGTTSHTDDTRLTCPTIAYLSNSLRPRLHPFPSLWMVLSTTFLPTYTELSVTSVFKPIESALLLHFPRYPTSHLA